MNIPTRLSRNSGFTLIELLTVIAIIGILAAIIIPVVGSVRKKARQAHAVSNLRQLATAHVAYAADNKDRFPPSYADSSTVAAQKKVWQESLLPYVAMKTKDSRSTSVMRQDPATIFNVPDSKPMDERPTAATSIARNWELPNANWKYRISAPPSPGRTILLGECEEMNRDDMCGLKADLVSPVTTNAAPIGFRRSEGNQALMAFCDTHVESLTRTQLVGTSAAAAANRWRWW